MPSSEELRVTDDGKDFYGREYWFKKQTDDLGYPDLVERARLDLPERCVHWLKTLLSVKLPPARVLEIGCAHGGFVALMQAAGFDALGVELSPFVVRFARETFQVPVLLGSVEEQHFQPASFDAIVMNDVLEHLPDPLATLRHCAGLLRGDGALIVQTPLYKGEASIDELLARHDRFLEQLKLLKGHLFLFSHASVRRILDAAGLTSTRFEQALFDYDQFLLAGRKLPEPNPAERADIALSASPKARVVRALLDKEREFHALVARLQTCEEDRAARLAVIESQGAQIGDLTGRLQTCEEDRAARLAVIESLGARIGDLTGQLQTCEEDRAARLAVIESQGARIDALVGAIGAAYPRPRLGIAFPEEVARIRRVLDDARRRD